jgi:hypothetical protein
MADPFLLAHHVAPRTFSLSGKISPVSIRDQMIRGRLFVDRAFETGEITSDSNRGLIIIGGGACGITAALRAAELGVSATVLESAPRLFGLQRDCATRWLDPAQYDWPLDHWTEQFFPWAGVRMPLSFPAAFAKRLVDWWWLHLQAARAKHATKPNILVCAHLTAPTPLVYSESKPFIRVNYTVKDRRHSGQFGAVAVTTGFGTENTHVAPHYHGYPFWQSDPFIETNLGLSSDKSPRVLISGGGDGALQDFLRITTRLNSASYILQALDLPAGIAATLKDIERRTACAFQWGTDPRHDHIVHMELEQLHLDQVERALQDTEVRTRLSRLLAGRPKKVQLVHNCIHLSPYYGLNRFLTLLISVYLKRFENSDVIRPKTGIISIRPVSPHDCAKPEHCHGEMHKVTFSSWPSCKDGALSPSHSAGQFNVIVTRHGIGDTEKAFDTLTPLARPRMILPYYLT